MVQRRYTIGAFKGILLVHPECIEVCLSQLNEIDVAPLVDDLPDYCSVT